MFYAIDLGWTQCWRNGCRGGSSKETAAAGVTLWRENLAELSWTVVGAYLKTKQLVSQIILKI
jgi:hypothetical protein